jgi:uncharacterized membrane protein
MAFDETQLSAGNEDLDRQTYARVGTTLLLGLLISVAVMILGLVDVAVSGRSASHVLPLAQVLPHLRNGDPRSVLDLGILLLLATPLAGVIVAALEFMRRKDRPFTFITLSLLVVLGIGFVVALH